MKNDKNMIFKIAGSTPPSSGTRITTRCPHCGHNGTFEAVGQDVLNDKKVFGLKKCPNEKCFGHLFFVYDNQTSVSLL